MSHVERCFLIERIGGIHLASPLRTAARLRGRLVRRAAPLAAIFYLAAIIEHALNYRPWRPISRQT
jgi:hypothetical protein